MLVILGSKWYRGAFYQFSKRTYVYLSIFSKTESVVRLVGMFYVYFNQFNFYTLPLFLYSVCITDFDITWTINFDWNNKIIPPSLNAVVYSYDVLIKIPTPPLYQLKFFFLSCNLDFFSYRKQKPLRFQKLCLREGQSIFFELP